MSYVEHTPGPWEEHVVCGDVRHYSVPGDRQVLNTSACWATGPKARSRLQALADARLIAAAPDLLDACRWALDILTCSDPEGQIWEEAPYHTLWKAINKAAPGVKHGTPD